MAGTMNRTILDSIGNTALVQLNKVVPPNHAKIFAKLEWQNPTGSMKDRMAVAVISRAEADGRLRPGDTVIEYTGGSTGASLALVCAAKGYPIHLVSSKAFSQEKLDHMAAYGAKLTLVPQEETPDGRGFTKQLFLDMIETARKLCEQPHTYWTDQLNNRDSIAGYFFPRRGNLAANQRQGRCLRPRHRHRSVVERRGHGFETL